MKNRYMARVTASFVQTAWRTKIIASLAGLCALAASAPAAVIINIQQIGDDVVATASGSLDLSGLTLSYPNGSLGATFIYPAGGILYMGTTGASSVYTGFTTFGTLGDSEVFSAPNSVSGDLLGPNRADGYLFLPRNYVSGTEVASAAIWSNKDFSTLGLLAGSSLTYTWSGDSLTINVAAPIPEPATAALLSGAGALVFFAVYRRRARLRS